MQAVCDVLEQLVHDGALKQYAIGVATAAGFHGEPLATRDIDVFVFIDPTQGSLLVSLEPLFSILAAMVNRSRPRRMTSVSVACGPVFRLRLRRAVFR